MTAVVGLLAACATPPTLAEQVGGCGKDVIVEPIPLPSLLSSRTSSWLLLDRVQVREGAFDVADVEEVAVAVPRRPDVVPPDDLIEYGVPRLGSRIVLTEDSQDRIRGHSSARLLVSTRDGRTSGLVALVGDDGTLAFVGDCADRAVTGPLRAEADAHGETMLQAARRLLTAG